MVNGLIVPREPLGALPPAGALHLTDERVRVAHFRDDTSTGFPLPVRPAPFESHLRF